MGILANWLTTGYHEVLTFGSRAFLSGAYLATAVYLFRASKRARKSIWVPLMYYWAGVCLAWALFLVWVTFAGPLVPTVWMSAISRGLHFPVIIGFLIFIRTRRIIAIATQAAVNEQRRNIEIATQVAFNEQQER